MKREPNLKSPCRSLKNSGPPQHGGSAARSGSWLHPARAAELLIHELAIIAMRGRKLVRQLNSTDPLEILPHLTLLVLLLNAFDQWYSQVPLVLLSALGFMYPRSLRCTRFWCLATALYAAGIFLNWASCDNHKYLICYWCLALCTVFELPRSRRSFALAVNARLLIGLCMALAVFWRTVSDCYHDGSFFHYALLVDPRFADLAGWIADAPAAVLAENRQLRHLLTQGYLYGVEVNRIALTDAPGLKTLGLVLTWWTLLLESAIAALFFWPDGRRAAVARNCLLLLFGLSTYTVATVRGFGWILMLLGLAQCSDREKRFRVAYLAMFLLIQAYLLPYQLIIDWLLGRA